MAVRNMERLAISGDDADVRRRRFQLPAGWPFLAILVLFPLWYVLGLGAFIWIILVSVWSAVLTSSDQGTRGGSKPAYSLKPSRFLVRG